MIGNAIQSADILLVSSNQDIIDQVGSAGELFGSKVCTLSSLESLPEKDFELIKDSKAIQFKIAIADFSTLNSDNDSENIIISELQFLRYFFQNLPIILISSEELGARLKEKTARFDVNDYISKDEFKSNSKFYFYLEKILYSQYIEIKNYQISVGSTLPFSLYYFMPINKKYLKIFPAGCTINEREKQKLTKIGSFFISGQDGSEFLKFSMNQSSFQEKSMKQKIKYTYDVVQMDCKEIVLSLNSNYGRFGFSKGKDLDSEFNDLMYKINNVREFLQINQLNDYVEMSVASNYFLVNRCVSKAFFVVAFSRFFKMLDCEEMVKLSLLWPLSSLLLPFSINKLMSHNVTAAQALHSYYDIAGLTIDFLTNKRVPLALKTRDLMNSIFCDIQGKDFKATDEAHILRLSHDVDLLVSQDFGKKMLSYQKALELIADGNSPLKTSYKISFLRELRNILK